jgi:hypothetical protein
MKLISSQRYLDEETVEQKIRDNDFTVYITPEFELEDEKVCAIIDGHHSLEAAKRAGVEPTYVEMDKHDDERIGYILSGDIDEYLQAAFAGDRWYDVENGWDIF